MQRRDPQAVGIPTAVLSCLVKSNHEVTHFRCSSMLLDINFFQHYDAVVPCATHFDMHPHSHHDEASAMEQCRYVRIAPNIVELHRAGCVETYVNVPLAVSDESIVEDKHKRHTSTDTSDVLSDMPQAEHTTKSADIDRDTNQEIPSDTEFFESWFTPTEDKHDKSWTSRAKPQQRATIKSHNPLGARRTRAQSS